MVDFYVLSREGGVGGGYLDGHDGGRLAGLLRQLGFRGSRELLVFFSSGFVDVIFACYVQ